MKRVLTLTQEQADVISYYRRASASEFRNAVNLHLAGPWERIERMCLNSIDKLDFVELLTDVCGYEVERPSVKAGDWRVRTEDMDRINLNKGYLFKVESAETHGVLIESDGCVHLAENTRPATDEEIKWGELGRQPGEFVEEDEGVSLVHSLPIKDKRLLKQVYSDGNLLGFYPKGSFIDLKA